MTGTGNEKGGRDGKGMKTELERDGEGRMREYKKVLI